MGVGREIAEVELERGQAGDVADAGFGAGERGQERAAEGGGGEPAAERASVAVEELLLPGLEEPIGLEAEHAGRHADRWQLRRGGRRDQQAEERSQPPHTKPHRSSRE